MFHFSSKNPAPTTLPGHCDEGGTRTSIPAQSGNVGTCRALSSEVKSRNANPLLRMTYFAGFSELG
jgi:hypothetical protein